MKTQFTDKEMFNAYSDAVAEYMKEETKLNSPAIQKIFQKEEFEKKFLENWRDFEFLEPSKVAKQMISNNRDIIKVKVVKVKLSNEEVVAVVPPYRLSENNAKTVATTSARISRSRQRLRRKRLKRIKTTNEPTHFIVK